MGKAVARAAIQCPLTGGGDDGGDAELATAQLDVERLAAPFPSPDAQDEGHATDFRVVFDKHVLDDVHGEAVQKPLRDVIVTERDVPKVAKLTDTQVTRGHVRVNTQHITLE